MLGAFPGSAQPAVPRICEEPQIVQPSAECVVVSCV